MKIPNIRQLSFKYWFLLLLLLAALAWLLFPRSKPAETVSVERGKITQTIVATGRVATPARVEVGAQVTGTVATLLVRESDRVKRGQLLLTLQDDETLANLNQAKAAVTEAQARIQQLKLVSAPLSQQTVKQAEANLKLAEAEWQRTQTLVKQGFFSQARLDEAERSLDNARAALANARTQATANAPEGAELALAQARLAQAEAALKAAQARADLMRISAPFDALVLSRNAEPGSIAQPGRVLLTLAQSGETRLYVNVDEKNLRYLQPGFQAVAVADAYPNQRIAAEVYFISPAIDPQRGTVEVRLRVAEPPGFLRPDMTVSVEMVVGQKEQALRVSSDAVRGMDGDQPYVLALRQGKAVRVEVKLGLRGVGVVEVLDGLQAGETVITTAQPVNAGDKVQPQARAVKEKGFEPPAGRVR
jgi:HlyD family secretion protein